MKANAKKSTKVNVRKPAAKRALRKVAPRFVPIGTTGKPWKKGLVVAMLDTQQNLMIDLADSELLPHAEAMTAAAAVRTCGFKDWRPPTSKELFGFVDHSLFRPAADPALHFLSEWYWTSTPDASDPGCAWFVHFPYGGVAISHRNGRCRVRAVRSAAPASQ